MKVGIITCHDVYNFGATLQAYALSMFLNQNGINCEIIDYKPNYLYRLIDFMEIDAVKWKKTFFHRWAYRLYTIPWKIKLLTKYCKFKKFNKTYLNLSDKQYHNIEELCNATQYSACICGSDQIWNSVQYMCGKDPAFYLAFQKQGKKIAYAASFGGTEISEEGAMQIQKYLTAFERISVREWSGILLLEKFGIIAEYVLDPVFLLDSDAWRGLKRKDGRLPKGHLLMYGYDNSPELQVAAKEYLQAEHCEVVSMETGAHLKKAGPLEFLNLVDDAQMVVTSSFHAVVFSIIFHKQFIAVKTGNSSLFERVENVLKVAGLEGRIWENLCTKENWQKETIDYGAVDKNLQKMVEHSKRFLLTAHLGECDL